MVEIIVWREQLLPPAMLSFRTGGRLPPSLAIPSSARDRPATRSPCLSGGYPLRFSRRVCTSVLGCDGGPVVRLIREGGVLPFGSRWERLFTTVKRFDALEVLRLGAG